jgi:hypothetical protein
MPPQRLDICEQMDCRVGGEVNVKIARMRRASSTSALVEQNDPIAVRVKELPPARGAAGTRSATEDERRLSSGGTARFSINLMSIADIEHAAIVCYNVGV